MKLFKRSAAHQIKRDLFDTANLDTFIVDFLGDRLAKMGENESGLYGYYKYFFDQKTGFAYYDPPIAKFLQGMNGRFARAIDVGAGIGQLSALLASVGFEAFAVERDNGRAAAAKGLFAQIVTTDPRFQGRLHLVKDGFPSDAIAAPDKEAVVIFTNVIISNGDAVETGLVDGLGGFGGVIVDLVRFTRARSSEAQWQALIDRVMAQGFGPPQEVFTVGEPDSGDPPTTGMWRIVYFPARS